MLTIASLTLWRMREPAFLLLLVVGSVIGFCVAPLGSFTSDIVSRELLFGDAEQAGVVLLGTILLVALGGLITVFSAAAEIPRDISSRMIAILLSKPVGRQQYVWGKFLGTLALGASGTFLWITVMLFVRQFGDGGVGGELGVADICRQYLCLLFLVPVAALSVGISCCFAEMLAMIVSCSYIMLCFTAALFPVAIGLLADTLVGTTILIPYYLFPNLVYFLQSYPDAGDYLGLTVYALCSAFLFLQVGCFRFERGDIF